MTKVFLARGEDGKAAARRAMAAAFASRGIPVDAALAETVLGKPYLAQYPGVQFNLSHSGPWGVCALSDFPVGVDVEMIRPLRRDVAKRFFTAVEQEHLSRCPAEEFFRLWTRKESFVKAVGRGFSLGLDRFSVLEDVLFQDNIAWYFQEYPLEGGYLTLCAQEPSAEFLTLSQAGQ